jgi:prevent-host-death family protein
VRNVNLVDAKAHLSKLVERAAAGDSVRITRHGEPVAQITAVQIPRKRIDVSAVRVMTDRTPVQRKPPATRWDAGRGLKKEGSMPAAGMQSCASQPKWGQLNRSNPGQGRSRRRGGRHHLR